MTPTSHDPTRGSRRAADLARVVVLISGTGSNLQALLDACRTGALAARVVAVVSNRAGAGGLERARQAGVPTVVVASAGCADRAAYDALLAEAVAQFRPDLVVLAGFMRIVGPAFLARFEGRIINLHPALPGAFPGTDAIARAWRAFQRGEIQGTGVMVHRVVPEVDAGPVVLAEDVALHPGEALADLEARVHAVEHRLLVRAVASELARLAG